MYICYLVLVKAGVILRQVTRAFGSILHDVFTIPSRTPQRFKTGWTTRLYLGTGNGCFDGEYEVSAVRMFAIGKLWKTSMPYWPRGGSAAVTQTRTRV